MRVRIGPLHSDASHFLGSSQIHGELIRSVVEESGSHIEDLGAILDFGCGYGRVLREWWRLPRTRVFGCDIDPKAVEWCNSKLPFAEVTANHLAPPLPYEGSSFDLVYALSVFTHLSESLQRPWIEECMRVLRPAGLLLFSTLGEHYVSLGRLTDSERLSFRDGNIVVLFDTSAGTSLCSAYHPYEYVRRELASGFELVLVRPAAADGQDVYLLRKPPPAGPARDRAD